MWAKSCCFVDVGTWCRGYTDFLLTSSAQGWHECFCQDLLWLTRQLLHTWCLICSPHLQVCQLWAWAYWMLLMIFIIVVFIYRVINCIPAHPAADNRIQQQVSTHLTNLSLFMTHSVLYIAVREAKSTFTRSCSSASDSAYSYTFLRSVVCLSSVTLVHPA